MLDTLREEVTKILFRAELRIEPPQMQQLPELPDFLTGHIDPLTGLDNSDDGDGSELAARTVRLARRFPARGPRGRAGPIPTTPSANLDISPQCAVPVRERQQVQALPRRGWCQADRLSRNARGRGG